MILDFPQIFIRLLLAVLLGGAVGIEREYKNRPAGMRTHVLVCLGACVIAILDSLMATQMASQASGGVTTTYGRISAQVISGVGFLGAGTIFTAQKHVAGLTTAASLWCMACIGLTIGMGYYVLRQKEAADALYGAASMAYNRIINRTDVPDTQRQSAISCFYEIDSTRARLMNHKEYYAAAEKYNRAIRSFPGVLSARSPVDTYK